MKNQGRDASNPKLLIALAFCAFTASGCQLDAGTEDGSAAAAFAAMLGEFAVSFARQLLAAWLL